MDPLTCSIESLMIRNISLHAAVKWNNSHKFDPECFSVVFVSWCCRLHFPLSFSFIVFNEVCCDRTVFSWIHSCLTVLARCHQLICASSLFFFLFFFYCGDGWETCLFEPPPIKETSGVCFALGQWQHLIAQRCWIRSCIISNCANCWC